MRVERIAHELRKGDKLMVDPVRNPYSFLLIEDILYLCAGNIVAVHLGPHKLEYRLRANDYVFVWQNPEGN